ncbi:Alpha/beta hydrolase family protein [Paenibacillus konkukensis]|uniref:Alpha/beta hydrolase family protein n=1 Tax=Paenibacillus konkukensis TaxID=2020716 RepID=A0ABY4RSZ6_9BACL|nr:Alpha/beta hydrolase family protein [Paenibacillus konkukensis]
MKLSRFKIILGSLLLVVLVLAVAASIWLKPYAPDAEAITAMKGGSGVSITDSPDWIMFEPQQALQPDVIFYPGGLVRPESYAPLAVRLADKGYRTWIVKMPLHLAVLGVNRAGGIIEMNPKQQYVIGGHSLGGAMAARYAAKYPKLVRGVFFLAAYSDAGGSLKGTELRAISLTGSDDGVLDKEAYEQAKAYMPAIPIMSKSTGEITLNSEATASKRAISRQNALRRSSRR